MSVHGMVTYYSKPSKSCQSDGASVEQRLRTPSLGVSPDGAGDLLAPGDSLGMSSWVPRPSSWVPRSSSWVPRSSSWVPRPSSWVPRSSSCLESLSRACQTSSGGLELILKYLEGASARKRGGGRVDDGWEEERTDRSPRIIDVDAVAVQISRAGCLGADAAD